MAKSNTVITKGPGRPKTTGSGHLVGVRVLPRLLKALDSWRHQNGGMSRPAAMRRIVTDYLRDHGYLSKGNT